MVVYDKNYVRDVQHEFQIAAEHSKPYSLKGGNESSIGSCLILGLTGGSGYAFIFRVRCN